MRFRGNLNINEESFCNVYSYCTPILTVFGDSSKGDCDLHSDPLRCLIDPNSTNGDKFLIECISDSNINSVFERMTNANNIYGTLIGVAVGIAVFVVTFFNRGHGNHHSEGPGGPPPPPSQHTPSNQPKSPQTAAVKTDPTPSSGSPNRNDSDQIQPSTSTNSDEKQLSLSYFI